jgi:hypothetical protein
MVTNNLVRRETVCTENRSQICTMIVRYVMSCPVIIQGYKLMERKERKFVPKYTETYSFGIYSNKGFYNSLI